MHVYFYISSMEKEDHGEEYVIHVPLELTQHGHGVGDSKMCKICHPCKRTRLFWHVRHENEEWVDRISIIKLKHHNVLVFIAINDEIRHCTGLFGTIRKVVNHSGSSSSASFMTRDVTNISCTYYIYISISIGIVYIGLGKKSAIDSGWQPCGKSGSHF